MALPKIQIGEELGKGWAILKENMVLMILSVVVAALVGGLTCGLLTPVLMAGVLLNAKRLADNDSVKPEIGDLFKNFDLFVNTLLLVLILAIAGAILQIIPVVGQLIAGLLIAPLMIWGLMFVAFERLSAIDAIKKLIELIKSGDFTMPLVLAFVSGLIAGLGSILCIVGVLVTAPLHFCVMVAAYNTLFANGDTTTPEDVPPPPPAADEESATAEE